MKVKAPRYSRFVYTASLRAVLLSTIVLLPSIVLLMSIYFIDFPFHYAFEGQVSNLSVVLIAAALSQSFGAKSYMSIMSIMGYYLFPIIVLTFILLRRLLIVFAIAVHQTSLLDVITLIVSVLYFILVTSSIEIYRTNITYTRLTEYTFEIKTPPFLLRIFSAKQKILINIVYVILRLCLYTGISIILTYATLKYFPFDKNIPNYFGVFSTIWTVITFVTELFLTRMKQNKD